jgi:hypothetical protein
MLVSPAAPAAAGYDEGFGIRHVFDNTAALPVPHQRTARNTDDEAFTVFAGAAFALTILPVAGGVFSFVAEIQKGRHMVVSDEYNVAAPAAVSAVRSAGGNIFLPMEGYGAVASVSGRDGDIDFIDKRAAHRFISSCKKKGRFSAPILPHCALSYTETFL